MWTFDTLILLAVFACCFWLRGADFIAGMSYVLCSGIHTVMVLAHPVPDTLYYASAVVADFVALIALCSIRPVSDIVYGLAFVCVASIVVNIVGYVAWWFYFPPWLYDAAFVLIYSAALVVVVKGGFNGMGGRPVRWHLAFPAFPTRARSAGAGKAKG